ncbi:MAG: hypothetical protein WC699_01530 [Bacteroidales bacterium]|jgi:hypothetical protein
MKRLSVDYVVLTILLLFLTSAGAVCNYQTAGTSPAGSPDTVIPLHDEAELHKLYNLKIRQADSAFNLLKDFNLAKQWYQDAIKIQGDKNYPYDQIVEIDKKLLENESDTIFSNLSSKFYVIAGTAVFLLLVLIIWLIIKYKKPEQLGGYFAASDQPGEPETGYEFTREDFRKIPMPGSPTGITAECEILLSRIRQLYPYLNDKLAKELEASTLTTESLYRAIEGCLDSENFMIRTDAELALMKIDCANPLAFLDRLTKNFTPWEQLHVFEMIRNRPVPATDFSMWLNSPNESVVEFSKKMIAAFRQNDGAVETDGLPFSDQTTIEAKGIGQVIGQPVDDIQSAALRLLNSRIHARLEP